MRSRTGASRCWIAMAVLVTTPGCANTRQGSDEIEETYEQFLERLRMKYASRITGATQREREESRLRLIHEMLRETSTIGLKAVFVKQLFGPPSNEDYRVGYFDYEVGGQRRVLFNAPKLTYITGARLVEEK